jgi:predicted TIM-barrel fold metal-dependent hydrolase
MEAERLYGRGPESLKGEGLHRLQDNLCRHLLELAAARDLPLIVHTGYAVPTEWGNPEHLIPLLTDPRLEGMKVDLSHSGWPRHGEAMVLARTYPNCYFNLCWTPLLSRQLGGRVLSEALDILPANKLLIGTDTGAAEPFLGAVWLIRSLLTEVLEEKVRGGQFGLEVAKRVACAILLDNPLAFYGMTEEEVPSLEEEPAAGCATGEAQRGTNVRLPFLDPDG